MTEAAAKPDRPAIQPVNAAFREREPGGAAGRITLRRPPAQVALLTASRDKPYALGLAAALLGQGVCFDFIGGDEVDAPELHGRPEINYLKLRNQRVDAGLLQKMTRVVVYYLRLIGYAATAKPRIFHILWNNKFEFLDRTALMLFYRLLGKKIVFTAHNVNAGVRDGNDSPLNRLTLRIQYRLCHHVFVHTKKMKAELMGGYGVPDGKVTVIPFGINNTVPNTSLSNADARRQLGLGPDEKTLLFFGNIAPYKGLEHLVAAFLGLAGEHPDYRLIIAGKTKGCEDYWERIRQAIASSGVAGRILQRIEYVPDEQTEVYFKAADVLVLPYTHVFQSGVLFLSYGFGVPVIASDVGGLKDEIIEGETGFVFKPQDARDLAGRIEAFFGSALYREVEASRQAIRRHANERYSWSKVAALTSGVYTRLIEH